MLSPPTAHGLVVFVHGSGSSSRSPRNRYVAQVLDRAGLGTLLFDLLTPEEERDRANVFDIPLLAQRLRLATALAAQRGLRRRPRPPPSATSAPAPVRPRRCWPRPSPTRTWPRSSPAAAARTWPGSRLPDVRCPTLLIVGGDDEQVLTLNRRARSRLTCPSRLVVVRGATHLFEEKGALERVADLARDWFLTHLGTWQPVDPRRPGPG